MKRLLVVLLAVPLSGCVGSLVQIDDPAIMSASMRAIPVSEAPASGGTILGSVEGYSCKNKAWNPAPTREGAADQLRIRANAMGATEVAGVVYEEKGTTLVPNCWSSIRATGVAIRR